MKKRAEAPVIVVSHESALRCIRFTRCRYGYLPWQGLPASDGALVLQRATANACHLDETELLRRGCWDGHEPRSIDVLIPTRGAQRSRTGIRQHVCSGPLPAGSLCEIGAGLYCTSPALTLLQLGTARSPAASVALAFELCGLFSMSEETASMRQAPGSEEEGYREAEPALTRPQLSAYLAAVQSAPGKRAACHAAKHALERARSPMEAITAALLHMPHVYGGFNIPLVLNHRIDFSDAARTVSGMPYAVCDAYAPGARSAVEYNGGYHDDAASRLHDERRRLGLSAMGIETYAVNSEQLRDATALEVVAQMIYRRAGKRYRNRTTGYRIKQVTLLNELRVAFGLPPC